jgi:hypothetical protein
VQANHTVVFVPDRAILTAHSCQGSADPAVRAAFDWLAAEDNQEGAMV